MEVEGLAPGDGALPEGEGAFAEGLWRVAGFGEGGADTAGVTGQLAFGIHSLISCLQLRMGRQDTAPRYRMTGLGLSQCRVNQDKKRTPHLASIT